MSAKYTTRSGLVQIRPSWKQLEAMIRRDDSEGYCLACGAEASGVEPDARKYPCQSCGAPKVYGAEELLTNGDLSLMTRTKSYGAIRNQVRRDHARDVPAAARPDWRADWATRKSQWVEATWIRYMRAPWAPLYAYYTPTDNRVWGELLTVADGEDPPAGAVLMAAERIPAGDKPTIARWLERFSGQLPVIPSERYS